MNPKIRQNVLPVVTALIWGTAFVAQSVGAGHVPPITFNALRCTVAFVTLALGYWVVRTLQRKKNPQAVRPLAARPRDLVLGGLCCGTALAAAACLQQAGLAETSPGKAGFITALYIVLVPIMGLFFRKRVTATIWLSVALAAVGLYFLCINEALTISRSDLLVVLLSLIHI